MTIMYRIGPTGPGFHNPFDGANKISVYTLSPLQSCKNTDESLTVQLLGNQKAALDHDPLPRLSLGRMRMRIFPLSTGF